MAAVVLPPVPVVLKQIQHYLKAAAEHDARDPVVAYWCRLYALQSGMKIDRKSKESIALLTALMDWLEKQKQVLRGNEAVTNDVVAQAHIENHALKLFLWADTEDRAERFNKNVVKAFYTAGMLFDILTTFGELTDEVISHRKYAKWKAAYIHNCLKNGDTPIAGPVAVDNENYDPFIEGTEATSSAPDVLGTRQSDYMPSTSYQDIESSDIPIISGPSRSSGGLIVPPGVHAPPSTPAEQSSTSSSDSAISNTCGDAVCGKPRLTADDFNKAQKYCKWAGSALQYEDVDTAVKNLQKALGLLTTGHDE